ncbi:MAG TPA: hypothetical protein VJ862_02035 [Rhodanobacteraceae bacterium]|nr:hypothetical protein [Rhodanobacteraceae bacterium]
MAAMISPKATSAAALATPVARMARSYIDERMRGSKPRFSYCVGAAHGRDHCRQGKPALLRLRRLSRAWRAPASMCSA